MGGVDWAQVARDYEASILDLSRLTTYAQMVATKLLQHGVPFDGYTDSDTQSFLDVAKREGFFKTLFSDKTGIDYQHIGYWLLAETYEIQNHADRQKTRYGYGKDSFSVRHGREGSNSSKWVLLQDGQLARYDSRRSTVGVAGEYGDVFGQSNDHRMWGVMTEGDILLLDHKPRDIERRYNNRSGSGYIYATTISTDNYLLTGKKGGGCSKKLTGLLAAHGLKEERKSRPEGSRSGSSSSRPKLPISATYALTADQLATGCQFLHTFKNGTTTTVTVNPNTRSGKVITVRTRQSGEAEALRLVQQ